MSIALFSAAVGLAGVAVGRGANGDGLDAPGAPGPFGPTNLRTRGGDASDDLTPADLADVGACAACHADAVTQWRESAHAQASFGNPFYRASVEDFARRQPPDRARFCGGCHDPVLVVAGLLAGADGPAGVAPEDPLAQVGVPCLVCHGARAPGPDGNASFTIDLSPVPLPTPGDAASLAAHVARLRPDGIARGALCGSCHRSHLGPAVGVPTHLPGIDDLGAWSRSPWSGSTGEDPTLDHPRQSCGSCHQPAVAAPHGDQAAEAGRIRSHRFPGAQTELAAGDEAQAQAVAGMLRGAVRVVVAGARVEAVASGGSGAEEAFRDPRRVLPRPGSELVVDVVVENVGAGHAFPGGTRDLQGATVVLEVADGDGLLLATSEADPHRLRSTVVDADGRPERLHRVDRFRAGVADTTVPAAGVRAVRHRLAVPAGVALPLRLRARVVHRRHAEPFRAFVCAAEGTERGRRFR
ncbi:MAG TPA: multiheme c-type cytochrome, partial [Polyangiaceae bacterium LLY-WYZ-14_1]|nr:multiheme c-type cytochrome [Polyangiaceae bacterium LLY-WYZ-14_1]